MQSLNIINLIEKNPITKLSNTYNNKLLKKIKDNFTESQQQLFISSFYCYLNYNQTSDFVIDLDNIWHWLGFNQKYNAKFSLEKNFIINNDYKVITQDHKNDGRGGHNKETIMLNIKTFKLFCIKAATKKANEIHQYFIKLEELLQDVIHEESNELKLQLDQIKLDYTNKSNNINAIEKEKMLLREFGLIGAIVYIVKVKSYQTGEYVIKIGESRKGITSRYNEHKSSYDEILLLDCFMCKRSKDFENFLHNHDKIKFSRVSDLKGHENERELFLIGKNLSYKTLLDIINMNIKQYNEFDIEKLYQEIESIKQLITLPVLNNNDNSLLQELVSINKLLLNKVDNLEKSNQNLEKSNKEILEKLNSNQTKTTTGFNEPLPTIGARLQQINPETMQLVKVFETVSECLKINSNYKRPSLDKAVRENTIYHGFRWLYVDRELEPNTIYSIIPTKQTKIQHNDYIVKLNQEKTEILNIYLDRKSACISNSYKSDSSLDEPVKSGSLYKGFYYILYNDCSDELKNKFIEKNGEPILYKDGICQYDSDGKLIREFICKNNCCKSLGISDKSLRKALEKNIMYNNYYYKHLGSKLQIYNIEPTNIETINTKPEMPKNFSICHITGKDHIQFSKKINNKLYSYKKVIKSYDLQKELDIFVNYIKKEYNLNLPDQKVVKLNNWKTVNKIK